MTGAFVVCERCKAADEAAAALAERVWAQQKKEIDAAIAWRRQQFAALYADPPPKPMVFLRKGKVVEFDARGGLAQEVYDMYTRCAGQMRYEVFVTAPSGFDIEERALLEASVVDMPRPWFDAALLVLVDAGFIEIKHGRAVATELVQPMWQVESQFNKDGGINEHHPEVVRRRADMKRRDSLREVALAEKVLAKAKSAARLQQAGGAA